MFIFADIGYLIVYYIYDLHIMMGTTLLFFLASFKAVYFIKRNRNIPSMA